VETKELLYWAYMAAKRSDDRSTKLGALIWDGEDILAAGANCFVPGFGGEPEHHERPLKYAITEHAERSAIHNAYSKGYDLEALTLVCPWVACPDCARAIVLSGISRVICHEECMKRTPERWRELVDTGLLILERGGVELIRCREKIGKVENLNGGEIWHP